MEALSRLLAARSLRTTITLALTETGLLIEGLHLLAAAAVAVETAYAETLL